jgi:hypothetical protein
VRTEHGPYPAGSEEPTYCELGTCYLSPAYKPMVKDLKTYLQGNKQIDFTQGIVPLNVEIGEAALLALSR